MNITAAEAIRPEHYYTVGKRQSFTEGSALAAIWEETQIQRGDSVSPEGKYRELSENREQRWQDLGLEYIDAGKCSWAAFKNLCNQVLERTEYDACSLEEIGITVEDETVEMDCLNYLRRWSEQQMEKGNMVGFHRGKKLSGAVANYCRDMRGETEVLEVNGEKLQARIMEDGMSLKANYLGSAFAARERGIVAFDAMYAADSTEDNPVIEIHMQGEDGLEQVYHVVLSEVDVRNATQLEMFALCMHWDRQNENPGGLFKDGFYMTGKALGIFPETDVEGFTQDKKDWVQAYQDKLEEIRELLASASLADMKKKYTLGNFELMRKEWEAMLERMEEMWQRAQEKAGQKKEPAGESEQE